MKNLVLILAVSLVLASCSQGFIPCTANKPLQEYHPKLMPLKQGNEWNYRIMQIDYKSPPVETGEKRKISINSLDTVYYKHENTKVNIQIYRINVNDIKVDRYGYTACDEGAIYLSEYGYSPKEIEIARTIPNNPRNNWKDSRNKSIIWHGPEKVTVPAGTFDCWYCEIDDPFNSKYTSREYYSIDVGLVKAETLNLAHRAEASMELVSFSVK